MSKYFKFPVRGHCRTIQDPCGLYECLSEQRSLCPYCFNLISIDCCTHTRKGDFISSKECLEGKSTYGHYRGGF